MIETVADSLVTLIKQLSANLTNLPGKHALYQYLQTSKHNSV